jgi:hypothetical protein
MKKVLIVLLIILLSIGPVYPMPVPSEDGEERTEQEDCVHGGGFTPAESLMILIAVAAVIYGAYIFNEDIEDTEGVDDTSETVIISSVFVVGIPLGLFFIWTGLNIEIVLD